MAEFDSEAGLMFEQMKPDNMNESHFGHLNYKQK